MTRPIRGGPARAGPSRLRTGPRPSSRAEGEAIQQQRAGKGIQTFSPCLNHRQVWIPFPALRAAGDDMAGDAARSGRAAGGCCAVAAPGQQAVDGDILVELGPVDAHGAQRPPRALLRRRVRQTRKPRQRHANGAAIGEVDPELRFVNADVNRLSGHATLVGSSRDAARQAA